VATVCHADSPAEVMRYRWLHILEQTIPEIDLIDVYAVLADP